MKPYKKTVDQLCAIPGVKELAALKFSQKLVRIYPRLEAVKLSVHGLEFAAEITSPQVKPKNPERQKETTIFVLTSQKWVRLLH